MLVTAFNTVGDLLALLARELEACVDMSIANVAGKTEFGFYEVEADSAHEAFVGFEALVDDFFDREAFPVVEGLDAVRDFARLRFGFVLLADSFVLDRLDSDQSELSDGLNEIRNPLWINPDLTRVNETDDLIKSLSVQIDVDVQFFKVFEHYRLENGRVNGQNCPMSWKFDPVRVRGH